ncbi:MAG: molybdopterin-dependent oxidoreductase [Anaerolineales bacterium]|nr:molybdopterin-dependent oxidoreductase [Anaerolineales bacterium]
MISLTINGQTVEAPENYTVLQAAEKLGITIPTLCYHKNLSPFGGCRLCVVEVQGARLPMTSCVLPVSPGLVVQTESPAVIQYRRAILRILLTNYYDAGYKRTNGKFDLDEDNELMHWARVYEIDSRKFMAKKPRFPIDSDPNPFVWVDMNKCIQCTRCVRACAEVQGRFVWSQSYRGYKARIVAGADTTMLQARCESCGACVAYCPTGALDNKMSVGAGRADRLIRTTCTYCGVGCQLALNVKDDVPGGRVIRVTSNTDESVASVNGLHLCVKGRYGYEFIHSSQRATRPRVREYLLDGTPRPKERGRWVEVDWDTALNAAAQGLLRARNQHGGQAIGVLASGKNTNEENYLLNKLARQALGTNHIDCCSHIYHAPLTEGLNEALGIPAMSNSFDDIASRANSLLVIGSNLTEQHPVFGAHIRQAVLRRKIKMIVANPDFTNIAEYAALPLYHRPNTETALINGLMHIILEKGWEDQTCIAKYPNGFAEFRAVVAKYTPQKVAKITGLSVEDLYQAAEILATNHPTAVLWSVGLADPSTGRGNVQSLANLQLLLGNLDIPGGGVNPLGGQNNIQGACDMGCLPELLPGYRRVADEAARAQFERAWGTTIPAETGLPAAQMLSAAGQGRIKALYLYGEDILNTSTLGAQLRRDLQACEFVVLQEILPSEATRYADVLLPGVSFAEKSGTYTSAERRIQMIHQAIEPIGEARPDWRIIADVARRILAGEGQSIRETDYSAWDYETPEQIFREIAALTPIYAGVSYERLERGERLQWPVDTAEHPGTPLLHCGYFSEGQARWTPVEQTPLDMESSKSQELTLA